MRRKYIEYYDEFDAGSGIKLSDNVSDKPIKNKAKVLSYLLNGKDDGIMVMHIRDHIKNNTVMKTVKCYTDGTYYWDDEEIYHFNKYNMKLDSGFMKYLKNKGVI